MTIEASRQKVGTGFWRQRCASRRMKRAVAAILAATLPLTSASADVGSSMDSFLNDVGGAANVNGPTAFEGQSAGYYSLGNVWTRFPQKTTNIANLQLPRARAGCGGIDIFAGSFSFINASEIVALLKAVANNAVGFAFSLAIDTVCPECSKIMQEFAQKAQLMNNLSINSCEMAQGLVGGIWPKGDLADKAICEAIGNSEGIFTDYAAAKHGCGTRGQRSSTNSGAGANYADVNPAVPRNYTWHVLKKSAFFSPNGTFDRDLAEYTMTLIGTVIYVPPKDDEPGKFVPFAGDASSTLVTALLDGTQGQTVRVFACDEPDQCLSPTFRDMSLSSAKAIRPRATASLPPSEGKGFIFTSNGPSAWWGMMSPRQSNNVATKVARSIPNAISTSWRIAAKVPTLSGRWFGIVMAWTGPLQCKRTWLPVCRTTT